jgi:hypothetical protein
VVDGGRNRSGISSLDGPSVSKQATRKVGDSLTNSVTFPENRLTETQGLADPSLGAKTGNSVTFFQLGSSLLPSSSEV